MVSDFFLQYSKEMSKQNLSMRKAALAAMPSGHVPCVAAAGSAKQRVEIYDPMAAGLLQAPARHKPGIEQHQRRALWPLLREIASYLQNRAADKPLRGRFGAGQSFDWDRHRLAPAAATRFNESIRES